MLKQSSLLIVLWIIVAVGCRPLLGDLKPTVSPSQSQGGESIDSEKKSLEETYLKNGINYYNANRLDDAISAFAEVLKLNPQNSHARQMFEYVLKEKAELDAPPEEKESGKKGVSEPFVKPITPQIIITKPLEEGTITLLPEETFDGTKTEKSLFEEPQGESKISPPVPEGIIESLTEPVTPPEEEPVEELSSYELARELIKRYMYDQAITELQKILKDSPNSKIQQKINSLLAQCYFEKGLYNESKRSYEEIIKAEKELVLDAQLGVADCLYYSGDYEGAKYQYLKVLKLLELPPSPQKEQVTIPYPKLPPTDSSVEELSLKSRFGLAESYRAKEEYPDAIVEYQRVIVNHPQQSNSATAYFRIGEIYDRVHSMRDYQKAVENYEKLIKKYPDSIWIEKVRERKKYIEENYL